MDTMSLERFFLLESHMDYKRNNNVVLGNENGHIRVKVI